MITTLQIHTLYINLENAEDIDPYQPAVQTPSTSLM